jgi:hypothetical protein
MVDKDGDGIDPEIPAGDVLAKVGGLITKVRLNPCTPSYYSYLTACSQVRRTPSARSFCISVAVTTSSQSESRRVKSQGIKQYIRKEGIIQKVVC